MTRYSHPAPPPTEEVRLSCLHDHCPSCQHRLRYAYNNQRRIRQLDGRVVQLRLQICRCEQRTCPRYRQVYRPESEGQWALPGHEFGWDVVALVGRLRYQETRSLPEIHAALCARQVVVGARTVWALLARYDEVVAARQLDVARLQQVLAGQPAVIIAIDGLQPDVGHEVLWVVRECLSGEVLAVQALLSSTAPDLAALLRHAQAALPAQVPVRGVVSDGQESVRLALAQVWPGVPHQLCQFHYLREAGRLITDADRHAKKELKKLVRGVRPLERALETEPENEVAEIARAYCGAVRSALTDDGRPPLATPGLQLHARLTAIVDSLAALGPSRPAPLDTLHTRLTRALQQTAALWPSVARNTAWLQQIATLLDNPTHAPAAEVQQQMAHVLTQLAAHTDPAVQHLYAVTQRYQPGLFHCYDVPHLPRTNNDLEHCFGAFRYQERRASGRKVAAPAMIVRGPARLVAATVSRLTPLSAASLTTCDRAAWRALRTQLEARAQTRVAHRHFRRNPQAFLEDLETQFRKLTLPA